MAEIHQLKWNWATLSWAYSAALPTSDIKWNRKIDEISNCSFFLKALGTLTEEDCLWLIDGVGTWGGVVDRIREGREGFIVEGKDYGQTLANHRVWGTYYDKSDLEILQTELNILTKSTQVGTLSGSMPPSQSFFTFTNSVDAERFPTANFVVQMDNEWMLCSVRTGVNVTVPTRGYAGSSAGTHSGCPVFGKPKLTDISLVATGITGTNQGPIVTYTGQKLWDIIRDFAMGGGFHFYVTQAAYNASPQLILKKTTASSGVTLTKGETYTKEHGRSALCNRFTVTARVKDYPEQDLWCEEPGTDGYELFGTLSKDATPQSYNLDAARTRRAGFAFIPQRNGYPCGLSVVCRTSSYAYISAVIYDWDNNIIQPLETYFIGNNTFEIMQLTMWIANKHLLTAGKTYFLELSATSGYDSIDLAYCAFPWLTAPTMGMFWATTKKMCNVVDYRYSSGSLSIKAGASVETIYGPWGISLALSPTNTTARLVNWQYPLWNDDLGFDYQNKVSGARAIRWHAHGITTNLAASLSNVGTTIYVTDGGRFPNSGPGGYVIQIEYEQILIASRDYNTLYVAPGGRGWAGTMAVAHLIP